MFRRHVTGAAVSDIERLTITLPSEMAATVKTAVKDGDYASTSEVVREALRDWKDKQERKAITIKELRRMVREGLDSGPGRYASMDDIKAEAQRRLEQRKSGT